MNKHLQLALLTAVLALSILGCALGNPTDGNTTTGEPNRVLFQDDFSDDKSGWKTLREGQGIIDYENGGFRIFVPETKIDYWTVAGLNFGDVHIETDVTKTGGPDDNDFGIICRYQDEENFYGLLISSDGYYGVSKMKNGEHNIVGSDGMQFSDTIRTGATTNRIGADCIGKRIVLYINGELLVEVEDGDFQSGDIGLMAGTFDSAGVDILFDNLVVTKP